MLISELPAYRDRAALLTTPPDATVREAAQRMTEKDYGAILVTDEGGRIAGILTERDLMKRVVARGLDPDATPVSEAMTAGVKTVTVDDDVSGCLGLMAGGRFRHLPVVDEEGRPQGMLSQRDFVALSWRDVARRAAEQTKASMGRNYQAAVIVVAILAYALIVQVATA